MRVNVGARRRVPTSPFVCWRGRPPGWRLSTFCLNAVRPPQHMRNILGPFVCERAALPPPPPSCTLLSAAALPRSLPFHPGWRRMEREQREHPGHFGDWVTRRREGKGGGGRGSGGGGREGRGRVRVERNEVKWEEQTQMRCSHDHHKAPLQCFAAVTAASACFQLTPFVSGTVMIKFMQG